MTTMVRPGLVADSLWSFQQGNAFFAPPYMLRRTMIFGGDDLEAFRAKLVTSVAPSRK